MLVLIKCYVSYGSFVSLLELKLFLSYSCCLVPLLSDKCLLNISSVMLITIKFSTLLFKDFSSFSDMQQVKLCLWKLLMGKDSHESTQLNFYLQPLIDYNLKPLFFFWWVSCTKPFLCRERSMTAVPNQPRLNDCRTDRGSTPAGPTPHMTTWTKGASGMAEWRCCDASSSVLRWVLCVLAISVCLLVLAQLSNQYTHPSVNTPNWWRNCNNRMM